jgi:hypothetical protein
MSQGPSRMYAYIQHLPSKISESTNLREVLLRPLTHIGQLEDKLIALFPQLGKGKVDNPFQQANTQSNQVPPQVQMQVTQKNGLSFITITPPQLQTPDTPELFSLMAQRGPNAPLAPLFHRVQSAGTTDFNEPASYVLGTGVWTLPDVNAHWRVQSSFDTQTFNDFSSPQKAVLLP